MERFRSARTISRLSALAVAAMLAQACAERTPTEVNSPEQRALALLAPTTWNVGDVFTGVSGGRYNVYDNAGNFKETINLGGNGFTTGCSFNPALDRLYTTDFSGRRVVAFDNAAPHAIVQDIADADASPESIVFDAAGNFFTGHADGTHHVIKRDASGAILATFTVATGPRGSDWVELAADQHTIFYASEGPLIRRFNTATSTQLADFASIPDELFALRLLPPGDGSGGLLIAGSGSIRRTNGAGAVVQTYDVAGEDSWFSLNLDPDGVSFWAGGINSGKIYKFNIATGAVSTIITTGAPGLLFGICVKGEITVSVPTDKTPPVCSLTNKGVDGSGHVFIQVTVRDQQSGLQSIIVTSANNADVPVPPFAVATNSPVVITATKIDGTKSSQIALKVTDVAGNVTNCDPVDASIGSGRQWGSLKILSNIPQAEGKLSITNATKGITSMIAVVNGTRFEAPRLQNGELRTLDISSALKPGNRNTIVLRAIGPSGANAGILIWDGQGDGQFSASAGYVGTLSGSN